MVATTERLTKFNIRKRILDDTKFEYPFENILLVYFRSKVLRIRVGKRRFEEAEKVEKWLRNNDRAYSSE